ncbi:MAG: tail fiber domain-containing protein [Bacteroidota bacterium]|nr:tail fiber domain-containing protein [Bacteroidota bacterium]
MNTHQITFKAPKGNLLKQSFICLSFYFCFAVSPLVAQVWLPMGANNHTQEIYRDGNVGIGLSTSNPGGTKLYLKHIPIGPGLNTSNFGHLHEGTYGAYSTGNVWGTLGMHRNNIPNEYFDYGLSCGIDKYGATFGLMKRPSGGGIMDAYIRWSYNEADPIVPNDLQFQFNNLTLGTSLDAVTFTSTGRVGIGSKAPQEKLFVTSNDITPFRAQQQVNGPFNYCAVFQVENLSTKAIVVNQGGWAENFIVLGDGTINPWAQTHIGDDLKIEGNTSINCAVSSSWDLKVNGDAYCTSQWTASDKNLKNNIKPLAFATDKIMKLKPVTYTFKQDIMLNENGKQIPFNLPKNNQIGFLAQELEEVLPEAVRDADGFKAVNYDMIIPVLTQAMQEQQAMIENQNEEIQQLKDKIGCLQPCNGTNNTIPQLNNVPKLEQNVPNPFGSSTLIKFYLPSNSTSNILVISDLTGKQIKKYNINNAGNGSIEIQGKEFVPGTYLYTLLSNDKEVDTKKMIIIGE